MDLVIDIGNFRTKGAFFSGDQVIEVFVVPSNVDSLKGALSGKQADRVLIASVSEEGASTVGEVLTSLGFSFELLDFSTVKVELAVDEPDQVGHDRIANVYGALARFPSNDCIVVDIGTAVTFDFVTCTGKYLGGAIYPGPAIGAKALHAYTHLLPQVEVVKPELAIAKTTATHIQGGLYWGLLGAIERVTFEMRSNTENPSNIKVIGTGGLVRDLPAFAEDLTDLTDLIDPYLTLVGMHEILKEKNIDQNS